jgi:hypothetical protein
MAAINLKVKVNDGTTKVFRFAIDAPIGDLLKDIREKIGEAGDGKDHGLFQAGSKGKPARWLKANRTMKFYGINNGVCSFSFLKKMSISTTPTSQAFQLFF